MDTKRAIIKTLYYSSLFHYPLTKAELWKYYINKEPISFRRWQTALSKLTGTIITYQPPFYVLAGQKSLRAIRLKRTKISERKLQDHIRLLTFLGKIPTIRLLGISGSLARLNAKESDDIDLFVITAPKTVWITRFILLFFLQLFGKRRRVGEKIAKDKICLNFLLDTKHIRFAKKRQDIYTAYEICQLRCVVDKNETYQRFLRANIWIKHTLPHFWRTTSRKKHLPIDKPFLLPLFHRFEMPVRLLQLWLMRNHKTIEVVRDGVLAFHPADTRPSVLEHIKEFEAKSVLWDIDNGAIIHYTRSDNPISPTLQPERFSFSSYE